MTSESAIRLRGYTPADWPAFVETMGTAFGGTMPDEMGAQWQRMLDPALLLVATDQEPRGEIIVGTAGWLPFDLTVPGGEIPSAAVTMVTVRPTHRRRGILRQMMRRQIDDIHAAGVAVATLWASESIIYHRFGYGLACVKGRIEIDPRRASFLGNPEPVGRVRLISETEALEILPAVYERIRREIPGSFKRSKLWWEARKLFDYPYARGSGGPAHCVTLELDGRVEGYALYRVFPSYGPDSLPANALDVLEALGTTPVATREIWRYLFSVDLIAQVRTHRLCAEHPLTLMLTDARRLRMSVADGTWIRLVDVATALGARRYSAEDALTFELDDQFCPWNAGAWTLETGSDGATVRRSTAAPELRLSVSDLAGMYLGTVSCTRLVRAGRVNELRPGASSRADAMFRSDVPAWCLDDF